MYAIDNDRKEALCQLQSSKKAKNRVNARETYTISVMRPRTHGREHRDFKQKLGGLRQIGYTYRMRSRSEYVRAGHLQVPKKELANFVKFRKLTEQWIDLTLKLSQLWRKQLAEKRPKTIPQTTANERQNRASTKLAASHAAALIDPCLSGKNG